MNMASVPLHRAPTPIGDTFEEAVLRTSTGARFARVADRNEHDAEDVVQEASLRAFRYSRGLRAATDVHG